MLFAGITLTFIEESGLLEAAESLGLLSAAADRCVAKLTYPAPAILHGSNLMGLPISLKSVTAMFWLHHIAPAGDRWWACRNTPNLLFTAAFALYALAPAAVYFLPDNTTALIAAQVCLPASCFGACFIT